VPKKKTMWKSTLETGNRYRASEGNSLLVLVIRNQFQRKSGIFRELVSSNSFIVGRQLDITEAVGIGPP
jgi:hypothetical protein